MITWVHYIHNKMSAQTNKSIRLLSKINYCSTCVFFIHVRVSWCVFCSMSLIFDYMCMHLPFIPWFIAGLPSSQALPGYLITAPPSMCILDVIGALACGFQTKKKKSYRNRLGSAAKTVVSWFAKGQRRMPKSISVTILMSTAWRTLG